MSLPEICKQATGFNVPARLSCFFSSSGSEPDFFLDGAILFALIFLSAMMSELIFLCFCHSCGCCERGGGRNSRARRRGFQSLGQGGSGGDAVGAAVAGMGLGEVSIEMTSSDVLKKVIGSGNDSAPARLTAAESLALSPGAKSTPKVRLSLSEAPEIDAASFEACWAEAECSPLLIGLTLESKLEEGVLEAALAPGRMLCVASGVLTNSRKYYFYASETKGHRVQFMAEVTVITETNRLSAVFKASPTVSGGAGRDGLSTSSLDARLRAFADTFRAELKASRLLVE